MGLESGLATGTKQTPKWINWTDQKLLTLRLCDLGLSLNGTMVHRCIRELYHELSDRGLSFRPHFWLSDEWFTPDGIAGIAVPFYMAHPRLYQLEKNQMFEVEGGDPEWCMQIIRHEAGHAIENAYGLRRRRKRQTTFGKTSQKYPTYYSPKPYSKKFVLHLDSWYAQSHPDEDFAETFAVWLTPGSAWEDRYTGWPALKKRRYVNEVMRSIESEPTARGSKKRLDPLHRLTHTLADHYRAKRRKVGLDHPNFYDRDLRKIFSQKPAFEKNMTAASFLRKLRKQVRREVARWTGEYQYTIDRVISDIIDRSQELNLRLIHSPEQTKNDMVMLLTVQTMNYLHSGRHRVAL